MAFMLFAKQPQGSHQHICNIKTEHIDDHQSSVAPLGILGSVASLVKATLYWYTGGCHKLWNIISTKRYILHAGSAGMLLHINGKFTMGKLMYMIYSKWNRDDYIISKLFSDPLLVCSCHTERGIQ
jgi:hypothetical protein